MKFECVEAAHLLEKTWHSDGPVMVLPFTDREMALQAAALACQRAGVDGLLLAVHDTARQGFIATMNQAFAATQSPLIGYMAQDAFAGRQWLALAVQALERQGAAFLGFNDGKWCGALASFGLANRAWAQANYGGAFFCPSYSRHYADVELTLMARQMKCYAYEPNSVLVEVDWQKDGQLVHAPDRAVFRERVAHGFDGKVSDVALLTMFS
jgi:hypothetical protein